MKLHSERTSCMHNREFLYLKGDHEKTLSSWMYVRILSLIESLGSHAEFYMHALRWSINRDTTFFNPLSYMFSAALQNPFQTKE